MSEDNLKSKDKVQEVDALESPKEWAAQEIPSGVDRRKFLMRSVLIGATAVLTGRAVSAQDRADRLKEGYPPTPPLSPTLYVVKEEKGPVMTERWTSSTKWGRAPRVRTRSAQCASPTISTSAARSYRRSKLSKATGFEVHLFGSLSATGKGHGTERASLAGLVGNEPATVDPAFLDSLRDKPDQSFNVKLGNKDIEGHAEGRDFRRDRRRLSRTPTR